MPRPEWSPTYTVELPFEALEVQPSLVLYDLEVPRIFLTTDGAWQHLWYLCDATNDTLRYIKVPTNDLIVSNLSNGLMTVHEVLSGPAVSVIDLNDDFVIQGSWQTTIEHIPDEYLPRRHAMLYAHLEPLLHLKLAGPYLHPGFAPASALKRGVDGAYLALKKLYEATSAGSVMGRPARAAKRLFDPPVQRMAFGSVEIAFANIQRDPEVADEETHSKLQQMGTALEAGLSWVGNEAEDTLDQPELNVLEAIEKLTPPLEGAIESVTIRGSIMPHTKAVILHREHARKIKSAIKSARVAEHEQLQAFRGYIREFDRDRSSFILRDRDGSDISTFVCEEDVYDDAYDAFLSSALVRVLGLRRNSRAYSEATAVSPVGEVGTSIEG